MTIILWISLVAVIAVALYMSRSSIAAFVTLIWSDWSLILCSGLVALAVTAIALNSRGIHPMSVPGMMFMGIVASLVGAIFLRRGETSR